MERSSQAEPMNQLSSTVSVGFKHYFQGFGRQVHELANRITDKQFWTKPYPYGNSFGNLVLHLTGNLNYYIGARIEDTGYVRNRELEFTDIQIGRMPEVLGAMDEAIAMVTRSLERQSEEDWVREYQAIGADDVHDRFSMYLRCCLHFHHHLGQMIYLVKELSRQSQERK